MGRGRLAASDLQSSKFKPEEISSLANAVDKTVSFGQFVKKANNHATL